MVKLIPKNGLIVRDPITKRPIPIEGIEVNLDRFWRRRIADGDVYIEIPKKTKKEKLSDV